MSKLTLNFYGEKVNINFPESFSYLYQQINKKLLIDASDLIITYNENSDKFCIENEVDFNLFLEKKIYTINLDVNQASQLYLDNLSKLQKENEEIKKKLGEIMKEIEEINKEKNKKKEEIKIVIDEKNKNIQELEKQKKELIKKLDKEIKDKLNEINTIKKKSQKEINLLDKKQKKLYETANSFKIKLGIIQPKNKINPKLKQKQNKKQDSNINILNKKEESKEIKKEIKKEEKKEIQEIKEKKYEIQEIKEKKEEIQEIKEEEEEITHENYACDSCGMNPIKGARYHCEICSDYDLCKKCYFSDIKKSHNHSFICINKPQNEEKKEKIIIDTIHRGILCNKCKINPIKGIRYKCGVCYNFDFCENCEKKYGREHDHPMLRLPWDNMVRYFECKMKNSLNNKKINFFEGIKCNKCNKNNIEGVIFKCSECKDYYLCEQCIEENPFEHLHPLIKIYSPNMIIDSVNIKMTNNYH